MGSCDFTKYLEKTLSNKALTISFPESTDHRVVAACSKLNKLSNLTQFLLFAKKENTRQIGADLGLEIDMDSILGVEDFPILSEIPIPDLKIDQNLEKSLVLLAAKKIQGVVVGASLTTSAVLKAGLKLLPKQEGIKTISSSFIMLKKKSFLLFSDCGVVIDPSAEQLVEIAMEAVRTYRKFEDFHQQMPRVAFLSFSTHGSAVHPMSEKMAKAAQLFRKAASGEIEIEGEVQFDAAWDYEVLRRKTKSTHMTGPANIYIFPDLQAANIGYKITQRLGGYQAFGPLLQGFDACYNDLSRGCSAQDIYVSSLITLLSSSMG